MFNHFDYDVPNLQELEPARFNFCKNWSMHHSRSKELEESQVES